MNLTLMQRLEGSPDITEWCPSCACRVVTTTNGLCVWCDRRPPRPTAPTRDHAGTWSHAAIARWREEIGI